MQLPSASKDLFIFAPSICLVPFCPPALSEPAKSTNVSLPTLVSSLTPCALSFDSVLTRRSECEREEASFEVVASFERLAAPTLRTVANYSMEVMAISVAPGMSMPSLGSSLKSRFLSALGKRYLMRQANPWLFRCISQYRKCGWWHSCIFASHWLFPKDRSWSRLICLLFLSLQSFYMFERLRIRFTASCCTVCEDCGVEAFQNAVQKCWQRLIIYLFGGCILNKGRDTRSYTKSKENWAYLLRPRFSASSPAESSNTIILLSKTRTVSFGSTAISFWVRGRTRTVTSIAVLPFLMS